MRHVAISLLLLLVAAVLVVGDGVCLLDDGAPAEGGHCAVSVAVLSGPAVSAPVGAGRTTPQGGVRTPRVETADRPVPPPEA